MNPTEMGVKYGAQEWVNSSCSINGISRVTLHATYQEPLSVFNPNNIPKVNHRDSMTFHTVYSLSPMLTYCVKFDRKRKDVMICLAYLNYYNITIIFRENMTGINCWFFCVNIYTIPLQFFPFAFC